MTTSIQTSTINIRPAQNRRMCHTYSVVINGEDGNYCEFEIEAYSENEAHIKAEAIAQECMVDVTYVEVYKIA